MKLEIPSKIDENLAELLGIIVGDGYVRTKDPRWLSIEVNAEEKSYIEKHVIPLVSNIFKCKPVGRFFNRNGINNTYGFYICSKRLTDFLNYLGVAKKHDKIRVPEVVIRNKMLYSRFLRGYFDTDGCLSFEKKHKDIYYYPRLLLSSVSKMLIMDVKGMTDALNICGTVFITSPGRKTKMPLYRHCIRGPEKLEKWSKRIGFSNPNSRTKYLIWRKLGHCKTNTSLEKRISILNNINDL
ncbi:MAG: LAGLIDADG family homing endonuclease [Candidatus Aenigmatarchaeota archaeon]